MHEASSNPQTDVGSSHLFQSLQPSKNVFFSNIAGHGWEKIINKLKAIIFQSTMALNKCLRINKKELKTCIWCSSSQIAVSALNSKVNVSQL